MTTTRVPDVAIPEIGAAGPGYATQVNEALAGLLGYQCETQSDLDAITEMTTGQFAYVEASDRTYRYNGSAWKPLDDVGCVNVQDYLAHWDETDNGGAFQDTVDDVYASGATAVIIVPAPPMSEGPIGYNFTTAVNLRAKGSLHFVARGGNIESQFGYAAQVSLRNTTNSNPIFDADNDATAPGLTGAGTDFVSFENISMYQPSATVMNLSHVRMWKFVNTSIQTFADAPALRAQNSFWLDFIFCSFVVNSGSTSGCVRFESASGNPDATNSYSVGFNTCRFSGGPMIEYQVNEGTGGGAGFPQTTFQFTRCDSENQAGDAGLFLRVSNPSTHFVAVINMVWQSCVAFDTVSGTAPWTIVWLDERCGFANLTFDQSYVANSGQRLIKGPGGNWTGLTVLGGQPVLLHDGSGDPKDTVYGIKTFGTYGPTFISHGEGAAMEFRGFNDLNAGLAHLWALNGDTCARLGIGHDGYFGWGDGTMETPDAVLWRSAAETLRTTAKMIIEQEMAVFATAFFGDEKFRVGGRINADGYAVNDFSAEGITWTAGSGSPEGVETARPGSIYSDAGEIYVKTSGIGNTGWKLVTHA